MFVHSISIYAAYRLRFFWILSLASLSIEASLVLSALSSSLSLRSASHIIEYDITLSLLSLDLSESMLNIVK